MLQIPAYGGMIMNADQGKMIIRQAAERMLAVFRQMHQEKVDAWVHSEYIFHILSERSSSHVRI